MRKTLLFSTIGVACAMIAVSHINHGEETITTVATSTAPAGPVPFQYVKTGTTVHVQGGAAIDLQVTNQSDKVAIAWVLISRHFKDDGTAVSRSFKVVSLPEEPNSGLAPGDAWYGQLEIPSADGRAVAHDLALDYVLFSDGTSWGPDAGGFSAHIAGQAQSRRVERARLREILERQGPEALAQELDKQVVPLDQGPVK